MSQAMCQTKRKTPKKNLQGNETREQNYEEITIHASIQEQKHSSCTSNNANCTPNKHEF